MFLESYMINVKCIKIEEYPFLSIHKTENFNVNTLRS